MKKLFILHSFLFFFLTSCITEQKARLRAIEFFREHPTELAETCADKFPVTSQYVQGITVVRKDTTIKRGIVLNCPESLKPTQLRCPDQEIIRIETSRVDTIRKENTARVKQFQLEKEEAAKKYQATISSLQSKLEKTEMDLQVCKTTSNKRLLVIIVICSIIGIATFLKVKRII